MSRLNPMLFFNSDKEIKRNHDLVTSYKLRLEAAKQMGTSVMLEQTEIDEIKQANRVAGGAVHPDTNEIIPFYMRLSGFVVFNAPLVFAVMFTPNQTPLFNAAMQWINQTYNAGMNYGNRNASSEYTTTDLARGYSAAVVTSVGIALISRTLMAKQLSSLSGPRLILTNAALNWLAAACAGFANCALMRQKELFEGIKVFNQDKSICYGKSIEAGKTALLQTGFSRVILPLPVLFFPSLTIIGLMRLGIWPLNVTLAKLSELSLCVLSLCVALPGSVAMFKQDSMLTREHIDEGMKNLSVDQFDALLGSQAKKTEGEKKEEKKVELVEEFYFNKGL